MNNIIKCSHPIPTKNIYYTHQGIKIRFNMALILTQKKNNTKIHKFNPYQISSQIQQLTYTSIENPIKIISENQPNINDINIQRQELNKKMHIANTLELIWTVTRIQTRHV